MDEKSTYPRHPQVSFSRAMVIGLGAGLLGGAVMTVSNKLEQLVTHRPNSYVPAHTTATLLGLSRSSTSNNLWTLNQIHHYGVAILAAPIRAAMSYYGVIGPFASFLFTGVRLAIDQVLENSAGTSAPPWTWPINEQVIDLLHKGVYAVVVGYSVDRLVRGVTWFN